jgi:dCMP deaminase
MNIDADFLRFACETAARWSDDSTTKTAAVIYSPIAEKSVYGVNHFPPGCDRNQLLKGLYIEHAERAAIYTAAKEGVATRGATMYAPWFACPDCARAIISAGIETVVGLCELRRLTPPRWQSALEIGDGMLMKAGVNLRWVACKLGVELMFDGKKVKL